MAAFAEPLLAIGGVLGLIVGTVLLTMTPWSRASRVFAVYVLLEGFRKLLQFGVPFVFPDLQAVGEVTTVYALLPAPFVLIAFALLYPEPRGRLGRSPWLLPGLVVLGLTLDLLFLFDHGLYVAPPGRGILPGVGPLGLIGLASSSVSAAVVLLFVWDFVRRPTSPHGRSLLLIAMVLAAAPSYIASRSLGYHFFGRWDLSGRELFWSSATAIPIILAMALLARHALGSHPEAERRAARRGLAAVSLGSATGAFVALLVWGLPAVEPAIRGLPAGIFGMASPLLMAYALLRYRLFDIDLKVKRSLRDGTVLASFAVVPLLTKEGVEQIFPGNVAWVAGIVSAGLLVVGLSRVRRFGQRVANAALPDVQDDAAYLNARKLEVYRSALEGSFVDGAPPPAELPRLAALRTELGLTERDHVLLTFALGAGRATPRGQAWEPGELALGRYRVERLLGEGGNGATFAARDEANGARMVALKLLRVEVAADEGGREAKALQSLRHPHVVELRDVAAFDRQTVLVMEYVEGGSLAARLRSGSLTPAEFATVARGLLAGLAAVHRAGMVHRDVKPSNVLLTAAGEAKLADFGIAQLPGFETTLGGGGDLASAIGTVRFMSPEQARGRRVTAQSDLFSAAATLYEAWTGRAYLAPFPGESAVELQMRAAAGVAFPHETFDGPPAFRAWFVKALAPRPEERFADAVQMLQALAEAAQLRATS